MKIKEIKVGEYVKFVSNRPDTLEYNEQRVVNKIGIIKGIKRIFKEYCVRVDFGADGEYLLKRKDLVIVQNNVITRTVKSKYTF